MALIFNEDFTGTDGVYMTTGNSSFSSVATNSGFYGFIFDNGGYSGTGVRETTDGGEAQIYIPGYSGGIYAPGLAIAKLEVKFYMDTNFPTVERGLLALLGTMDWVTSYIQTDGKIRLENQYNTSTDLSAALPVDTWIRASLQYDGLNDINLEIFHGANVEGTTPDETLTLASLVDGVVEYAYVGYVIGSWSADTETVIYDDFDLFNNILPPVYTDFTASETLPAPTETVTDIADGAPNGRIDDFGLWEPGDIDSAISQVVSYTVLDNADWVRTHTTATRPRDYFLSRGRGTIADQMLWRKADYGVASVKWASVAATESHLLDSIQFEKQGPVRNVLSGNAANFEKEMVYAKKGYNDVTVSRSSGEVTPYNGEWCLKVVSDSVVGHPTYHPLPEVGMAPASEGEEYVGSLQIKQTVAGVGGEFDVQIRFYDADFVLLQENTPVFWAPPDSKWYRYYRTVLAPADTAWVAAVGIANSATAVAGDTWYVDDVRLFRTALDPVDYTSPSEYVAARKAIIKLRADSVNYIKNPGPAYDGGYGWMPGVSYDYSGAAANIDADPAVFLYGDNSIITEITSAGTGYAGPKTERTEEEGPEKAMITGILPNTPYVASAWVRRGATTGDVQCAVLREGQTDIVGFSYDTVRALDPYDQDYVKTDSNGYEWVRLYCPFTLEADAEQGGSEISFFVYLEGDLVVGDTMWVNAWQVQEGSVPTPYFDGSMYTSEVPDFLWEENTLDVSPTPFWARSHWYDGRRAKVQRVEEIVMDNLPKETPYEIRFAQPAKERRILRDVYGNPLP